VVKTKPVHGLGFVLKDKKILLFYRYFSGRRAEFQLKSSGDGFTFEPEESLLRITDKNGQQEKAAHCLDFRLSLLNRRSYFLTYKLKSRNKTNLFGAISKDLINWRKLGQISSLSQTGMLVPNFKYQGKHILYFGEKEIKIACSPDLKSWKTIRKAVLRKEFIKIGDLSVSSRGILLAYFGKKNDQFYIKLALFDKKNPAKLLWISQKPVWEQPKEWGLGKVIPLGIVNLGESLISYWEAVDEGIYAIKHTLSRLKEESKAGLFLPFLQKFRQNPILGPIKKHFWESQAVFNPAAVFLGGKIHLIYRAVGDKAISVFGYAASKDGSHIEDRLREPVYVPREPFELNPYAPEVVFLQYLSGGGCGGCEDPRITRIDGRLYLTYTAWNGYQSPRVAITSINEDDFLNHRWNWQKPVLISPPNQTNKNWVIFPEKIKGKYAILHSLSPQIMVNYFDNLDFDGQKFIYSYWSCKPRVNHWDTIVRGVGPPPIKTKDGWLIIYHAATQDCGYKMGAMILDSAQPQKILYRSRAPILGPSSWYENEGLKPRIIYGCGAVVVDDELLVYYGGADTVSCVAKASLNKFLDDLKYSGLPRLEPVKVVGLNSN
jgi:predicted GH43/DUF377 family glycosyl hydrolase